MKFKNHSNKIIFVIILLFSIVGINHIINRNQSTGNINKSNKDFSDKNKKFLKYDYEISNNINVLDIMSNDKLVVEDSNKLKLYNIAKKKYEKDFVNIHEGFEVKDALIFDKGIIWVENKIQPSIITKVYIKYFSSNKIDLLDESTSEILPSMSISSKYLTYYIINENNIKIKSVNLEKNIQETIATYPLKNGENINYVSIPNTNDKYIVWSYLTNGISNILKYDINTKKLEHLKNTEHLKNPVIKNNRIVAIKKRDIHDSKLAVTYASDYIVEYNFITKQWTKFSDGKIDNYIDNDKECITALSTDKGLLYWLSTLSDGKYVYNFSNDKFTSLINNGYKNKIDTSIKIVKNNIIYYEANDYNNNISKFIYNVR
ncbi:hypothetical protein [Clostridium botulinum]|uniref:hypothetical protein n=1 Tax=Clostridium botulinum TaxID=1491 RepID=UPI0013F0E24E|nr:hypothetical protein [Clostridium botulinum]MCC5438045.1 hypothetical protein [Clostridium botulinum]NFD28528.1 hypothetical protein [Clostridium botulinum]NFD32383.1 hypothetical protein [Clostridium botulinum]NFD59191.1 hypothetical protein [Clostridium botulinum]NFE00939.1 hypothetical protein [Clostridium botulinum]